MSFWGVEVKPGKPYTLPSEDGRIHITQATLGNGSSSKKSTVQCNVGNKSPIFLCTLFPEKIESCALHLEFEDDHEVIFSVIGPRSVHLSGFHTSNGQDFEGDDDSLGEDIAETESEESTDYDAEDDYEDDFIDDGDIQMFPPSPIRNSGVVIEEILDDEKAANGNSRPKQLDDRDNSQLQRQMVVKSGNGAQVFESEDEDGFPISPKHKKSPIIQKEEAETEEMTDNGAAEEAGKKKKMKKKTKDEGDSVKSSKRKNDTLNQDTESERKKKNKMMKAQNKDAKACEHGNEKKINALKEGEISGLNGDVSEVAAKPLPEEKKKKKKKKAKAQVLEGNAEKEQTKPSSAGDIERSSMEMDKDTELHPSQVRTFGNGLVVEELAMGKPDGKKASIGKKVSVHYIGKLKKTGKIFDSNIGTAPFKFRLGVNQVIKGWDVGVKGMRVGDKRRLTIPPSMAYGDKRVGPIPANSWLVFEVELVDVQ